MQPSICTEGLTRHFGDVHAVDDLTLEVPSGIVFGFLGPNGSGKTTTIRLLLGLLEPTAGRAEVLGYDTRTQADEVRARTGALLEHAGLYERLTALDNLDFYGRIYGLSAGERAARIEELLRHVDLWDRRNDVVDAWSRGMRQKLAVARAMLHRPPLTFSTSPPPAWIRWPPQPSARTSPHWPRGRGLPCSSPPTTWARRSVSAPRWR